MLASHKMQAAKGLAQAGKCIGIMGLAMVSGSRAYQLRLTLEFDCSKPEVSECNNPRATYLPFTDADTENTKVVVGQVTPVVSCFQKVDWQLEGLEGFLQDRPQCCHCADTLKELERSSAHLPQILVIQRSSN